MWRVCHNLLLIKDNLLKRKIVKEPLCPIYGRVAEMVYHACVVGVPSSGGHMVG
jgi:hypothetical protein